MPINLDFILGRYRTSLTEDLLYQGMRINRLFGLQDLIIENLDKNSIVCEVGSLFGHSASLFAYYCKEIYCVDVFNHSNDSVMFDTSMEEFNNVHKIISLSIEASFMFKDFYFDLVYIDAGHEFEHVVEDITHWMPKIKAGGFLAGHDYHTFADTAVIEALNSLKIIPDKVYEDSSWIKRIYNEI
jgi:cephalosporin hydroxylase